MLADHELIDRLAAVLEPEVVEPSRAEIAELHELLDRAELADIVPLWGRSSVPKPSAAPVPRRPRAGNGPRQRPWTRRIAGIGIVALVFSGVGTAAALSGADVPTPVRDAARAVGLPVESTDLAETRAQMDSLQTAITLQDPTAASANADALRLRLSALGGNDAAAVAGRAQSLLNQAAALSRAGSNTSFGYAPFLGPNFGMTGAGGSGYGFTPQSQPGPAPTTTPKPQQPSPTYAPPPAGTLPSNPFTGSGSGSGFTPGAGFPSYPTPTTAPPTTRPPGSGGKTSPVRPPGSGSTSPTTSPKNTPSMPVQPGFIPGIYGLPPFGGTIGGSGGFLDPTFGMGGFLRSH